MSRFTMTFRWQEQTQELTWEDGTLSSPDEHLVSYIEICAEAAEGRPVGLAPTGPFTTRRTLEDLTAHGIVVRHKTGKADQWTISDLSVALISTGNEDISR